MQLTVSQVEKQPTATHVESGTAHTDAEPATKVDGTPAAVVADETAAPAEGEAAAPASKTTTEVAEDKKEDKKVAIKVSYAPPSLRVPDEKGQADLG